MARPRLNRSRHLFPARLTAVATGRRVRARGHARRRGHARGGQAGRSKRRPTRAGSRGHGDTRPLQLSRVAPGHARGPGQLGPSAQPPRPCRSALTLAQARAPPDTLAPRHPAPRGRPPPLREPSLCRQPDKAPARGPLHHLPETGVFVTCRWAPSPTHPHKPTHPRPRTHK